MKNSNVTNARIESAIQNNQDISFLFKITDEEIIKDLKPKTIAEKLLICKKYWQMMADGAKHNVGAFDALWRKEVGLPERKPIDNGQMKLF